MQINEFIPFNYGNVKKTLKLFKYLYCKEKLLVFPMLLIEGSLINDILIYFSFIFISEYNANSNSINV